MCEHHHVYRKNSFDTPEHVFDNHLFVIFRVSFAFIILVFTLFLEMSDSLKFLLFLSAYILAGGDILLNALKNILHGEVFDENFLMSVATIGAFSINEYPEAVMVMILYQLGEYLQHTAVEKSRDSISALMDIRQDYANVEVDGQLVKKSPENIAIGDIIIVTAGEKIPLDGVVIDGKASVDTSALTGESKPQSLKFGDRAISGYINNDGVLKIQVEKQFGESTVSKILKLVEDASSKKAVTESFIKRFAKIYTPVVVIFAVLLASIPPLFFNLEFNIWFERALTFLVISCPCALVISVPLSFFAGIGAASKSGILIKGSSYLELLTKAKTVVFDKTGTLTKGTFVVTEIVPQNGISKEELLKTVAMAESYSNHPIAVSVKKAYGKAFESSELSEMEELAGYGIKVNIDRNIILAGNEKLMNKFGISFVKIETSGTVVYCARDGLFIGYIVISDEIKEEAKAAISEIEKYASNLIMLTGDTLLATKDAANKLGIKNFYAQLFPEDKVHKLEEVISLKKSGTSVVFVGDGINDAPVLTRADVGIAMGALGSDAAIEAADIVIMDDNLFKVATGIKIAKNTMQIVKQNIIFAIGIKILFLLLGACGFMTMWGAVFADVGVTLLAVLNSLRAAQVKYS